MTEKQIWKEVAFPDATYDYPGDALKRNWSRLHQGDCEPFPDPQNLQKIITAAPRLGPKRPIAEVAALLQDGWRAYHRGDFGKAVDIGLSLGLIGHALANKAANIYATYLETDQDRRLTLWQDAADRATTLGECAPRLANAWYFGAQALGRYGQEISIARALAQGLAGRIKGALDKAIALAPSHADAHIALGTYHAEIVGKVGGLVGSLTYGASKDQALTHFQQALTLNPTSAIARIEFANGLARLFGRSRLKDAKALYREAAACTPCDAMERLDVDLAKSDLEEDPS
jgi:tetratricopeptide (TPR) repeat protein